MLAARAREMIAINALEREAKAEERVIKVQRERAELLTIEDAARGLAETLRPLRTALGNFSGRWSPECVGLADEREARAKLDVAVLELMRMLAATADAPAGPNAPPPVDPAPDPAPVDPSAEDAEAEEEGAGEEAGEGREGHEGHEAPEGRVTTTTTALAEPAEQANAVDVVGALGTWSPDGVRSVVTVRRVPARGHAPRRGGPVGGARAEIVRTILSPPPQTTVIEWAEEHLHLPSDNTAPPASGACPGCPTSRRSWRS
jgi:hypothetical protein